MTEVEAAMNTVLLVQAMAIDLTAARNINRRLDVENRRLRDANRRLRAGRGGWGDR